MFAKKLTCFLFLSFMLSNTFADETIPYIPTDPNNVNLHNNSEYSNEKEDLHKTIQGNFVKIDHLMISINQGIQKVHEQFAQIDQLIARKDEYTACAIMQGLAKDIENLNLELNTMQDQVALINNSAEKNNFEKNIQLKRQEINLYVKTQANYKQEVKVNNLPCSN